MKEPRAGRWFTARERRHQCPSEMRLFLLVRNLPASTQQVQKIKVTSPRLCQVPMTSLYSFIDEALVDRILGCKGPELNWVL